MTTVWGPYYNFIAYGVEVIVGVPNHATGRVAVTFNLKVRSSDGPRTPVPGSWSFSYDGSVVQTGSNPSYAPSDFGTVSALPWMSYAGPVTIPFTFDAGPAAHEISGTVTIPQRLPDPPSAPTAVSASYVSDSRIDVSWTRPANASADATIWSNAVVQRQSASNAAWVTVATLSGTATTYSDTTTAANDRYRYRVAGKNVTGTGSFAESGYVSTTPAAPTSVSAAKDGSGNIIVSWTDNARAETGFEIHDGETLLDDDHPASPYTHVSPSNLATHSYRVQAVADGPRYSAWSAYSNTVQLLAAPAAPDDLTPNGTGAPVETETVLSWTHVPTDSSPQSSYELQHRLSGGSWTNTGEVTSTTSSHTLTAGTYPAGSVVEWQVRTSGEHPDPGPWSAVASYAVSATPTATINAPSATLDTSSTTVEWGYYNAAGSPQAAYEVRVVDADSGVTYASTNGTGTATAWTTPASIPNNTDVDISVRVRSAAGIWSAWDEVTRSVLYVPPLPPILNAAWVDGFGYALVEVFADSDGVAPETASLVLERSVDGGNTWVEVGTYATEGNVLDYQAPSGGTFHYRATALSTALSASTTVVAVTVPAVAANRVIWLGGGPGYAQVVKLAFDPEVDYEGGRERTTHAFAGRSVPVEFSSMRAPKTISVSATLLPDINGQTAGGVTGSSRDDLEDLFDLPGPHLYRDPTGRVLYGTLSGLSWSRAPGGKGGVSFSITRSAPPDAAQAAALAGFYAPRIAEVAPGVYRFINADADEASPGVYVEVE